MNNLYLDDNDEFLVDYNHDGKTLTLKLESFRRCKKYTRVTYLYTWRHFQGVSKQTYITVKSENLTASIMDAVNQLERAN